MTRPFLDDDAPATVAETAVAARATFGASFVTEVVDPAAADPFLRDNARLAADGAVVNGPALLAGRAAITLSVAAIDRQLSYSVNAWPNHD